LLRHRLLVVIIGVPLGVAVIILGGPFFFGFAVLIALLALHEFYTLTRPYRPNLLVGYLGGAGLIVGCYLLGLAGVVAGLAALLLLLFFWAMGGRLGEHLVGRMSLTSLGVLWIALGLGHLVLMRELDRGLALTILVFGGTWLNDTFAYIFGRWFGRRRIAPRISPKKTMAGAVAGLAGAVLFAMAVKLYSPWLPAREAAILGLVVGLAGQFGDLFESAVKRDLRIKDSGRLLPGHGGILDRFDSVLFAGPACYWGCWILLGDVVSGFPVKGLL
jgi:phosphatidate cytidylyltransferase